ncbi:septum formation family protein [Streptomonospora sp. S1-112]|uniref:Septum formation family protein n=1 Tax=Streptomonospora mangrovi TaxID=2883123 RepID=A0A9X3NNR0_9ACTN|nr:septum formation family protein [Streptomonospora mangrovi]MDA0567112.1 septum formation family protein [Streptomonospora mangrovi]
MPTTTMRPRIVRVAATAAVAAAGLTLSGCGLLASLQGNVFTLEVGDCLAEPLGMTEISEIETAECSQPHESEVFASVMMEDGDYPGDEAVATQAEETCVSEFESFVGMPYMESELDMDMLHPTQESWESMDDREILCVIYDPAGQTTGSLSGAAR